jgi:hypothetical protein
VGVDDGDMARAIGRLAELGGGMVAVEGRGVRAELPLPVAGLLSDQPLDVVLAQSEALSDAAAALGCTVEAPFHAMSFLALSVIPSLKITDQGLVDVDQFRLVSLAAFCPPTERTFESPLRSVRPGSTYSAALSGARGNLWHRGVVCKRIILAFCEYSEPATRSSGCGAQCAVGS